MRKNKTWTVDLFDHSSVLGRFNVEQGQNDEFWTNDTEAYLNFKPNNDSFEFTEAELTMYNKNDGSLVVLDSTDGVEVENNVVSYEMQPEVIAHFGKWTVQVRFIQADNESFTSGIIEYEVKRALGDAIPEKLSAIKNWDTFFTHAQETIDLIGEAELTRAQNEENRRSNEVSRVNAESQRANNEQDRIQAEAARESRLLKLEEAKIKKYGVRRVLGATTTLLERLGDAVGLEANADNDLTKNNVVRNDFDSIYPWSHMRKCIIEPEGRVVYEGEARYGTAIGDWMVEIPEFYWLRTNDGTVEDLWVSENPVGGYAKSEKFYIAQFKTAETESTHVSRSNHFPAVMLNRAGFREKAVAKGEGWRLMDLKARFILTLLYRIEFANLNSQQVLGNGVTSVRYTEDDLVQIAENDTNRVVLLSANADNYNVGDAINVGTARGNMSGGQYRLITAINDLGNGTKEIIFDGEPTNVLDSYKIYMAGQISGRTLNLLATSGTAMGVNYRASITYRGIEDIFGNVREWVDGSLINDKRGYVCLDPVNYSDTLTSDYLPLNYVNATTNGYAGEMGFDSNFPYADYTIDVTGGSATKYSDYYYQNAGLRAPLVGGNFHAGVTAGLWYWLLNNSPASAHLSIGARLLKTP